MERLSDLATSPPRNSALDPCRYVREADFALLYGSREDAVALIAQTYLVFDLALESYDELTGKASSGRNSSVELP